MQNKNFLTNNCYKRQGLYDENFFIKSILIDINQIFV